MGGALRSQLLPYQSDPVSIHALEIGMEQHYVDGHFTNGIIARPCVGGGGGVAHTRTQATMSVCGTLLYHTFTGMV